jgi:hypothetical protein
MIYILDEFRAPQEIGEGRQVTERRRREEMGLLIFF